MEDDIFYREIVKIKGQSCSVGNFATKIMQKFFQTSELDNHNCMGSRRKVPLEPNMLKTMLSTQKEQ